MDAIRQDDVYSAVMVLWPRCKLGKDEFAAVGWPVLRNYGEAYAKAGLKRHRANYRNATRPDWDVLPRELASEGGGQGGSGRNDFEILIWQVRRHLTERGVKHVEDWTDGDVFENHQQANPHAKHLKFGWRNYLEDIGETVPSYLAE